MPRKNPKEMYDRIRPYVEQYAREYYGGNLEEGFRHWAFNEKFLEYDLSDTDVIDRTAIDGTDDFEVDGYLIEDSEEEKVIHLFQSKYRSTGATLGSKELSAFLESPIKLIDPHMVVACRNAETKSLHDYLIKLVPDGCLLNLVWVSNGKLSPQARQYAESNAVRQMPLKVGSTTYDVKVSLEAMDIRDLDALFQSHLESDEISLCNWEFTVDSKKCHEVSGDFKTIVLTVPAKQIIDVFGKYKYRIFRLNPRGPLGNKTNTSIKASLQDTIYSHMFHLLNNGLSAICQSYRLDGDSLYVQDFQIVNGCQTTVTLWNSRAAIQNDPAVLVNLRLIECHQNFHKLIANTTNTQAPLRAEDFISTDNIQIEMQRQFDALSPPWFYQVKRSEWSRMIGGPRQKARYAGDGGSYRWLKSKDVAQAVVAFLGFPGEAKDKIRFFFDGTLLAEFGELAYKDVYTNGLSAEQILLPALVYQKVIAQATLDKADVDLGSNIIDWLDYARLHLVWLIGELLRSKYHLPREILTRQRSATLISTIDDWFTPLYTLARACVGYAVGQARQDSSYRGHREFFRSPGNYRTTLDRLPDAVSFARQFGDPFASLPTA